mgnify:CR=1 FL=1
MLQNVQADGTVEGIGQRQIGRFDIGLEDIPVASESKDVALGHGIHPQPTPIAWRFRPDSGRGEPGEGEHLAVVGSELEDHERPRVIVVSARASSRDRQKAKELGADAFVAKPFNVDELPSVLKQLEPGALSAPA